jgi:hypothetical protein
MNTPLVKIGFDPGSSLTKVIYTAQASSPKILVMEPHVFTTSLIPETPISFGSVDPLHHAWLKLHSQDENCYLVGSLAKNQLASLRLNQLKHEQALYKLLAIVGVIAQRENLQRFGIEIAALLPYGEYENRKQLEKEMQTALRVFYFRGKRLNVSLKVFICAPEGGGLAWSLRNVKGEAWFNQKTIVVLMFGHRNTSCLTFRLGQLVPAFSSTTALGFFHLLQGVVRRTAGQHHETMATPIFLMGANPHPDHPLMRQLLLSSEPQNKIIEAKQLSDAIAVARTEHWKSLSHWISDALPAHLDALVISGGGAQYFRAELTQFLDWANPVWSELSSQVSQENLLNYRMVDIWHLFLCCFPAPHLASEAH